jgi:hypothetical protein
MADKMCVGCVKAQTGCSRYEYNRCVSEYYSVEGITRYDGYGNPQFKDRQLTPVQHKFSTASYTIHERSRKYG